MFSETSAAAVTCGIMNPEFNPGFGVRNAGSPDERGIDQHGDAALGQRADFADGERDDVGGESDGLGVKVAAGQRFVGVGEDQRIVGDAVRLACQRRRGLAQDIERRAHHLRLAAQAIGVLHAVVVCQMRGANRAARHEVAAAPAAVSIWPRWPRKAWMRGSNGASDPRAASVDRAPLSSAD